MNVIVITTVVTALALAPVTLCMAFWPKTGERLVLVPVSVAGCAAQEPDRFVRIGGSS